MSIYLIDDKKVDASEAFDSRLQGPSESFTSVTDSKSNRPKIYKEMHETIIHNGKVVKDVNMIQTNENLQINGIVNGQKIAMSIDNPSKETSVKDSALRTTRKFRNNHVKFSDSIATPMNHIQRIATPYNSGVAVSTNTNKKSSKNPKKKSSKNTKKKSMKKRSVIKR